MKLNLSDNIFSLAAALTLTSAIALMSTGEMLLNPGAVHAGPRLESTLANAQMAKKSGMFVAAEHPTSGNAKIVTENGTRYLVFDQSFKSDAGPDLHVILYRDASVPVKGIAEANYVILGRLQKVNGMQRYVIPASIKLADYGATAIWCRQFNATFGYATLES